MAPTVTKFIVSGGNNDAATWNSMLKEISGNFTPTGLTSTNGGGLNLTVQNGVAHCGGVRHNLTGGPFTLVMNASTTNYVFYDPTTEDFHIDTDNTAPTNAVTIASVLTGVSTITTITDTRVTTIGGATSIANGTITYAKIQNVSATNKLLGRSTAGAGVIEEISCTSAGRDLLDDASASVQRTTLGLGTIATQASNNISVTGGTVSGITLTSGTITSSRINPRIGTTASSATPTPNADTDDEYTVTALAVGATFGAPTGTPVNGQKLILRILDNGTARSLAWNAIYRQGTSILLPTTTTINKTMYVGFIYNTAASKWDLLLVVDGL